MTFINFGTELINLVDIYEIDFRDAEGGGIQVIFYYHLANSTGVKTSKPYKTATDAVQALRNVGIDISATIETADD